MIPSEPKARAQVLQYHALVSVEVSGAFAIAGDMFANRLPYVKPTFQAIVDKAVRRLQAFEKILVSKTFLVGERITLADISLAFAVLAAFSTLVDPSVRASLPNVVRLTETVTKNSKVEEFTKSYNFLTEAPKYTAPPKEKKPEAAKAPKEAAPKAPKAPKAKEADDEDDEPLVPAEPKAKNPLDDLPKSSFNLEEWKRQYSNLDTRKEALPWFYENFDNAGFSVHKVSFKYNDELTQVFMSSNQIGGFFNRLEASRKYLFGSVGVLGKANDSIITGALICRGQDVEPVVNVAPDWSSYAFEKLDLSKPEDKEFFEGAMAWDLVVDGKEWADGKVSQVP